MLGPPWGPLSAESVRLRCMGLWVRWSWVGRAEGVPAKSKANVVRHSVSRKAERRSQKQRQAKASKPLQGVHFGMAGGQGGDLEG